MSAARSTRPPSRLVVTGDILRPVEGACRPSQATNIGWLFQILRRPLARATGIVPELLVWNADGIGGFDTPRFFRLHDEPVSLGGWARLFGRRELTPTGLTQLLAHVADSLVIGYEMPPVLRAGLQALGVPFVDVVLHPARYLDDVFLGFATDRPELFEGLLAARLGDDELYDEAALLLAGLKRRPPKLPPDVDLLLAGQTETDRSVIGEDGAFLSLADFADPLQALVSDRPRVLFKPHPYAKGDFGIFASGLRHHAIVDTRENFYALLASEQIETVCSVSSSTSIEARYFDKKAIFLHRPPFELVDDGDTGFAPHRYVAVKDAFLGADFWRRVLAPLLPVSAADGRRPPARPNQLRTSLRMFWGFNAVSTDIVVEQYFADRKARTA